MCPRRWQSKSKSLWRANYFLICQSLSSAFNTIRYWMSMHRCSRNWLYIMRFFLELSIQTSICFNEKKKKTRAWSVSSWRVSPSGKEAKQRNGQRAVNSDRDNGNGKSNVEKETMSEIRRMSRSQHNVNFIKKNRFTSISMRKMRGSCENYADGHAE